MRQFWLVADGVTIPLNGENGVMLCNVSGLGATISTTQAEVADGFYNTYYAKGKQGGVSGDLAFIGDAYGLYFQFANTLLTAKKLQLRYSPNTATRYTANVSVNYLTKGESYANKSMKCPVSFTLLTPWFTSDNAIGAGSVAVTEGGQIATAVIVSTTSGITNPTITLADSNGTFAEISLNLTTQAGKTLEYSNMWDDSHILYDGADAIGYADLSKPLFGHSRNAFTITCTNALLNVSICKYWRTV